MAERYQRPGCPLTFLPLLGGLLLLVVASLA